MWTTSFVSNSLEWKTSTSYGDIKVLYHIKKSK
jgi:hypothetical protein